MRNLTAIRLAIIYILKVNAIGASNVYTSFATAKRRGGPSEQKAEQR